MFANARKWTLNSITPQFRRKQAVAFKFFIPFLNEIPYTSLHSFHLIQHKDLELYLVDIINFKYFSGAFKQTTTILHWKWGWVCMRIQCENAIIRLLKLENVVGFYNSLVSLHSKLHSKNKLSEITKISVFIFFSIIKIKYYMLLYLVFKLLFQMRSAQCIVNSP